MTSEQVDTANTLELALKLHKFPHEVEALPLREVARLMEFIDFQQTVEAMKRSAS